MGRVESFHNRAMALEARAAELAADIREFLPAPGTTRARQVGSGEVVRLQVIAMVADTFSKKMGLVFTLKAASGRGDGPPNRGTQELER